MNSEFSINVARWEGSDEDAPEVAETSCSLSLQVKGVSLTQAESDWSKSVSDSVYVSGYPLALWLTSSWWRLRWESGRAQSGWKPPTGWRMNHELAAVGGGFIWPRVRFESDGETMHVSALRSPAFSTEPIRYLNDIDANVSAKWFEKEANHFVETVLSRLSDRALRDTDLQQTWDLLCQERASPEQSTLRILEAKLGFDPGAAPHNLLQLMQRLAANIGEQATAELAAGIGGDDAESNLRLVNRMAERKSIQSSMPSLRLPKAEGLEQPWHFGREMARSARKQFGFGREPISNAKLLKALGIKESFPLANTTAPIGLAVRDGAKTDLHFHKWRVDSQRFEAARFLGDYLIADRNDRWLTTTDASTLRQKTQRAFAAEFLAPIAELEESMQGDFSPDSIADAADRFEVAPLLVRSHLANHGLIDKAAVNWE
ncbi:MAG TPA: hypothetical protein VG734_00255 [Lacunisphaera sp.]|nr:hypothetical protein [Lacunisphaera sp.]